MKAALASSQKAIRNAGWATRYLILLALPLLAILAGLFAFLTIREGGLENSIREDALWAVYQLDREAGALAETARLLAGGDGQATPDELATLTLRYDILYSRLTILDNTQYDSFFETSATLNGYAVRAGDLIRHVEPFFNAVVADQMVDRRALADTIEALQSLQATTGDFLTRTNAAASAARADARSEIMRLQKLSGAVVVVLFLTLALLVLNLLRQLRIVRRATDNLHRMTGEITAAYNAAEEGNRAKSRFMATIGHEIRTPLNAILGMAELVSTADMRAEDRDMVATIKRSGETLLEIINEILDFAKIEHGEKDIDLAPFACGELLRQCIGIIQSRAADGGNVVVATIAPRLEERMIVSDQARFRRVVLNLLSNAAKFTENGRIELTADLEEEAGEQRLRIAVSDTGIGIPEDAVDRLFNAFAQVDSTIARRYGGTGLGLAICKQVVDLLGGCIGVESEAGTGSRFWFDIPVSLGGAIAPAERAGEAAARRALPRLEILVVEDNPINQTVIERFLKRLGQAVTVCDCGMAAIEALERCEFDLVLMDMQMPELDGIETTRRIKAAGGRMAQTPIVALTANASESDRALCLAAGMVGFESKPITLDKLSALIRHIAGAQAAAAQLSEAQLSEAEAGVESRIDAARLDELKEALGSDCVADLLEAFFADSAEMVSNLEAALRSGSGEASDAALHLLKGAAANLGFRHLSATAEAMRGLSPEDIHPTELSKEIATLRQSKLAA